jgi:predicted nucleic acid-binding protein
MSVIKFQDFEAGNLGFFRQFRKGFANAYRSFVRELPNELHSLIRDLILQAMVSGLPSGLKVRFTIDANVVVKDSVRVAKGKSSTTDKLLGSPYVKVFAPLEIKKEVVNALKNRLKDSSKRDAAFRHAKALLSRVKLVPETSSEALSLAKSELGSIDQSDVPYLAVSIDTCSTAILSQDKRAFDSQKLIKRYDLEKFSVLILNYHEGGFALVISSATLGLALRILTELMVVLYRAVVCITGFVVRLVNAIVSKSIEALSKLPKWFLVGFLSIVGVVGLISLLNESFRDKLLTFIQEGWARLKPVVDVVVGLFSDMVKSLWEAIRVLVLWVCSTVKKMPPYVMVIFGVLGERVFELLHQLSLT